MNTENITDQFYQSYIGTIRSPDPIKLLAYCIARINTDSPEFQLIYNTDLYQTTIQYWHDVKYASVDNAKFETLDDVYQYMHEKQNLHAIVSVLETLEQC